MFVQALLRRPVAAMLLLLFLSSQAHARLPESGNQHLMLTPVAVDLVLALLSLRQTQETNPEAASPLIGNIATGIGNSLIPTHSDLIIGGFTYSSEELASPPGESVSSGTGNSPVSILSASIDGGITVSLEPFNPISEDATSGAGNNLALTPPTPNTGGISASTLMAQLMEESQKPLSPQEAIVIPRLGALPLLGSLQPTNSLSWQHAEFTPFNFFGLSFNIGTGAGAFFSSLPFTLFSASNPYIEITPNVSFTTDTDNDLAVAQLITHIQQLIENDSHDHSLLSGFLNDIQSFIVSLQANEIPQQYPLNNFEHVLLTVPAEQTDLHSAVMDLFMNFRNLMALDYFMYGVVTQETAITLAQYIQQFPNPEVEEVEAGAGWFQAALSQQGIDILSSDNLHLLEETYEGDVRIIMRELNINRLIRCRHRDYLSRGPVREQDALEAVKETQRKILLLSFPHAYDNSLQVILDKCARKGILIIHISHDEETFHSLSKEEDGKLADEFIPVDDIPDLHIYNQVLEIGFWGEVPQWYQEFRAAQGKPPLKRE